MARMAARSPVLLSLAALLAGSAYTSQLIQGRTFASGLTASSRARSTSQTTLQAADGYWEGEWICADCGYIYNERAFQSKFEDLQGGFKCPACAAPRRR
eukprot:CAMPEP_0172864144 /NCGR_PEP_ID=MMETSP1075-20121228/79423_1 /TAXON_ID=2916 /ORGANISM="Ceratium fusus, Strain PA161109" /LENGTH=98 /DNA_ID=CAMNT_0013712951 /DNA_START=68 /DNA_END=360 /DNA_ORIENTATION=+